MFNNLRLFLYTCSFQYGSLVIGTRFVCEFSSKSIIIKIEAYVDMNRWSSWAIHVNISAILR
jgi:hypothetical protein